MASQVPVDTPNQVEFLEIGAVEGTDRELYGRWVYTVTNTESFTYQFQYRTNIDPENTTLSNLYTNVDYDNQWFSGAESTVKYDPIVDQYKNKMHAATYSPPENATKVRFRVLPNAKKHKVNGKDTAWYTSKWSNWVAYNFADHVDHTPEKPSAPTVEILEKNIKVYVDTYDSNTKYIRFEIIKNDKEQIGDRYVEVKTNRAITWFNYPTGGVRYKIRATGFYAKSGNKYTGKGQPSEYSEDIYLPPSKPDKFDEKYCNLMSASCVQLFWLKANGATSYEIEYTTNPSYFDSSDEVQKMEVSVDGNNKTIGKNVYNHCEIEGLTYQPSTKYYFRVRSKNDAGISDWNAKWPYFSMTTGIVPSEPTTWSERSVLAIGDNIYLYWTHNTEDGSTQTKAEIEFTINDGNPFTDTINDKNNYYVVDMTKVTQNSPFRTLGDGDKLSWRVRTMGVLTGDSNYSPWSTKRVIEFHVNPTVYMRINSGSVDPDGYSILLSELSWTTINTSPLASQVNMLIKAKLPKKYNSTSYTIRDLHIECEDYPFIRGIQTWGQLYDVDSEEVGFYCDISKTKKCDIIYLVIPRAAFPGDLYTHLMTYSIGEIEDQGALTQYPLHITSYTSPTTQEPISYRYTIISNETYETVDNRGDTVYISQGDTVYNQFVKEGSVLDNEFLAKRHIQEVNPYDVTLENGVSYTCQVEVLTDVGLTGSAEMNFTVELTDLSLIPNAEIAVDGESFAAYITPYCQRVTGYSIDDLIYVDELTETQTGWVYTHTLNKEPSSGEDIVIMQRNSDVDPYNYVYTCIDSGEDTQEYQMGIYLEESPFTEGTAASFSDTDAFGNIRYTCAYDGDQTLTFTFEPLSESVIGVSNFFAMIHYITADEIDFSDTWGDRIDHVSGIFYENNVADLPSDITLSVYRRSVDGEFIEIATGIQNDGISTVADPHPALDYARYRIVAQSEESGGLTYYDVPDYPINSPFLVIQWDEQWRDFGAVEENEMVSPVYSGSRVMIKGNVDVSNSYAPEVELIEYIGRSHPVAYHGTQIGETASWSCAIPADDVETLAAIRRLARWMGTCYVREPSGSGYWATVGVSFSRTHSDVIIPITFSITRTEGGM